MRTLKKGKIGRSEATKLNLEYGQNIRQIRGSLGLLEFIQNKLGVHLYKTEDMKKKLESIARDVYEVEKARLGV